MITPISVNNLIEGGWRSLLSVTGIGIAVVLIFMQLGFLGAVLDTAVVFYRNLEFDLIARSPDFYQFIDPKTIRQNYLQQVANVDGVDSVLPFHVSLGNWTYAEHQVERGILIMGVSTQGQVFRSTKADGSIPDLSRLSVDNRILVDKKSRPGFLGEGNKIPFSDQQSGLKIEINKKRCEVSGVFEIGTGLAADGAILINEAGYRNVVPGYEQDQVAMGLIQLSNAWSDRPEEAKARIQSQIGVTKTGHAAVEILTRREVQWGEIRYWITNTPVGLIFITGVVVAFIVGGIIVYIVLSSDITRQIGEYATLKAMGYRDSYLNRIVLEQALILGTISYIGAFFVSLVLYKVVGNLAELPITMTMGRQLIVFVSTLAMCIISGSIASKKLRSADPADLF